MTNKTYILDVIDAEDGSGDKLLQFSEEFLVDQDWRENDKIEFVVKDEAIYIKNLCCEERKKGDR